MADTRYPKYAISQDCRIKKIFQNYWKLYHSNGLYWNKLMTPTAPNSRYYVALTFGLSRLPGSESSNYYVLRSLFLLCWTPRHPTRLVTALILKHHRFVRYSLEIWIIFSDVFQLMKWPPTLSNRLLWKKSVR